MEPPVWQLPEQHWLLAVHAEPRDLHAHDASELHDESEQSICALQLSSRLLPQTSAAPEQSSLHVEQFSPASQVALPQQ